ncbi:MAG: hypothetical protein OXI01_14515 [Albidovulum sp.]|nr:hypothetical protein [Albidovulum sp.]
MQKDEGGKPLRKSRYDEEFEPLRASPEEVARRILSSPPKKPGEWEYLNRKTAEES